MHSYLEAWDIFSSPEQKAPRWAISIPMTPASVPQHFQTSSPLKPLGQLNSNFILRLLRMGEPKFVQIVLVTWPRWPPCPYMVKPFKNLLLQNQKTDDLGTWYVTFGMWGLPSLFKWWSYVDLDLLNMKVKFASLYIKIGFFLKVDFLILFKPKSLFSLYIC